MSPAFHPQFQHRPQFLVRFIPAHMGGIRFCQTGLIRSQRTGWIPQGVVDHRQMPDTDSESTESVHFVDEVLSDVEAFREEIDVEEVEVPLPRWPRRMFVDGLRSLDGVDIRQIFRRRALVMKSVPKFMQGSFRAVLKAIMEEVSAARLARDVLRQSRAWKAFLLLPRLLLHKPPRGGLIQKKRLEERLEFARGNWLSLLTASEQCAEVGSRVAARRRRRPETTLDKRQPGPWNWFK